MTHSFRDHIIGAWTLVDYTRKDADGNEFHPFGKDASGYLLYTPDGYMSAQLMAQGRRSYSLEGLHNGTQEELAEAAHGYHAYAGKYVVDEENHTLYHHMEVSLIPNRLSKRQDRIVSIDGEYITITSQSTSTRVVWKRAENHSQNSIR